MSAAPVPFTGRKMLVWMLAFFGVVIAANLIMMSFALTTHTGVVVPNSYAASQDFNHRIADDRAQRERGWRVAFDHSDGVINVAFKDSQARALRGLAINGVIGRPVTETFDQSFSMTEDQPGRYTMPIELAPGEWRLELTATDPRGETFRFIRQFTVRKAG